MPAAPLTPRGEKKVICVGTCRYLNLDGLRPLDYLEVEDLVKVHMEILSQ